MKKLVSICVFVIGVLFLQSCSGPEGARGPVGPQGPPGVESEVFEVTTTFAASNDYSSLFTLNPAIYASDMLLVYELAEIVNGQDVWKLLPQTYYVNGGELRYNYDFTKYDFRLFMESPNGTSFLNSLDSSWKNNITFRIVIVPGYFSSLDVDVYDMDAVMGALKKTNESIIRLEY